MVAGSPDISGAAAGDRQARGELVRVHGPAMFALCRRLAAQPEDAYQEAWIKVFRSLARFDPGGSASLKTWVLTITRRHLIDLHRRRSARGAVVSLDGLAASDPSPDDGLAQQQSKQRLEHALTLLPDAQRRAVVNHHLSGQSLEAIAAEEGTQVGTIKSRLHRGRARLLKLLRSRP